MTSWHILKTRTNRELSIHDFLDKEGISCYTPFDTRILRSSSCTKKGAAKNNIYSPGVYRLFVFQDRYTHRLAKAFYSNTKV